MLMTNLFCCLYLAWWIIASQARAEHFTDRLAQPLAEFAQQYCTDCHGVDETNGGVDLARMLGSLSLATQFKTWEKVASALESRTMPPESSAQPTLDQRRTLVALLRSSIADYQQRYAGDPGDHHLRRLTSAQYGHTIRDLTGLDLGLDRSFVNDAVGGEGFTNAGSAQFLDDASLERYMQTAKIVADHAVVGAGPLSFFSDPGKSGRELSAIHRIARIYREHGFRTGAGEGAEPFGLDLYPRSFYVAWLYRYRDAMNLSRFELADLARQERVSARLCEHIWHVLSQPSAEFPLSMIIDRWRELPAPIPPDLENSKRQARAGCENLGNLLREWQSMLAASAGDEEEAAVLTSGEINVSASHHFKADINWNAGAKIAAVELSVTSASDLSAEGALVVWKNPQIQFRNEDSRRRNIQPLIDFLTDRSTQLLALGAHPRGAKIGPHDFVLRGDQSVLLEFVVPQGARAAQLTVAVALDKQQADSRIVRCRIADGKVDGETAAEFGATSTLLAEPGSPEVTDWRKGVAIFASLLPEVSHREPAPSDRDPIPSPFDNAYNKPERNFFHTAIKYHRDDAFLVEHVLDNRIRIELNEAWTDLLTSFDYHARVLRFIREKFRLANSSGNSPWTTEELAALPYEIQQIVSRLSSESAAMQIALQSSEVRHVENIVQFAEQAWRRPLTAEHATRLQEFYKALRRSDEIDHERAIRLLLVRVLSSPDFVYHADVVDPTTIDSNNFTTPVARLANREFANRLSYFLWSSLPDAKLTEVAASGTIRDPLVLRAQVERMLRDEKARRLAEEFFGQWLGFYRFDEYRGIDASKFPEFSSELRDDLYNEAITFFERVVREQRPASEILFADYIFTNSRLAKHYNLKITQPLDERLVRVSGASQFHRGGILGLGALHAVTSAPLRTSAVKRGDWVLRRLLNSPVPPPPADAGSISADETHVDGLTVRQHLEAHRTQSACTNCHSRIDPLGFALENFDPIGRWREAYRDGQKIDTSGKLLDGTAIDGLPGLRKFLHREQSVFERTLATKLLGFAIGRAELASDQLLINGITTELNNGGSLANAIFLIVSSPQFNNRQWEANR